MRHLFRGTPDHRFQAEVHKLFHLQLATTVGSHQFVVLAHERFGRTTEEVAHLVEPWVEDVIEPLIYSDATRTIARHRQNGDRILVISASGTHLVKPIAARIGIDEVLGIELDVAHGVYSGKTVGVLTYREGKITRLMQWLEQEGESLEGAYFYSYSRNDLPLLSKVDYPQVVNPDPVLRAHW